MEVWADARGVALVEDEIEDAEDRPQPLRDIVSPGEPDPGARGSDSPLRAADALPHRRLRHEEGASDLRCRQATYCPQRERNRRGGCEARGAAHDEERQRGGPG